MNWKVFSQNFQFDPPFPSPPSLKVATKEYALLQKKKLTKKFTKQLIMILPKHLNSVNPNIRG